MNFTYEYPRPALSADCVLLGWRENAIHVLLIQRKHEPFAGRWALPGGFVDIDEDLEPAAQRELEEETHIQRVALKQLKVYGAVDRDPRTRVVTVAHWGLVTPAQMQQALAGDDAAEAQWHPLNSPPKLAFDHATILRDATERLRDLANFHCIGKQWLPRKFSATQLVNVYRAVLGQDVSKAKLIRGLSKAGVLVETEGLLSFDAKSYRRYQDRSWQAPWQ